MAKSAAGSGWNSGTALLLWLVSAGVELVIVLFAGAGFDEVADASPYGRAGTVVVIVAILAVALAGTVLAWRGAAGAWRVLVGCVLFVAAGLLLAMAIGFLTAGLPAAVLAVLLLLAAVQIVLIGAAVLRSSGKQSSSPATGGR